MVIMNQEEKNLGTDTSEDSINVGYAVLVKGLVYARLYMFTLLAMAALMNQLETWFSSLLMGIIFDGPKLNC